VKIPLTKFDVIVPEKKIGQIRIPDILSFMDEATIFPGGISTKLYSGSCPNTISIRL